MDWMETYYAMMIVREGTQHPRLKAIMDAAQAHLEQVCHNLEHPGGGDSIEGPAEAKPPSGSLNGEYPSADSTVRR